VILRSSSKIGRVSNIRSSVALALLLCVCLFASCGLRVGNTSSQPATRAEDLDAGSVAANVYTNNSLGIRLRFPESLVLDSLTEMEELGREGVDLWRPSDARDARTFDRNVGQEKIVFSLSTPESETSPGSNLNRRKPSAAFTFMVWSCQRKSKVPVFSLSYLRLEETDTS
jgi:hypothetical protein